MHVQINVSVGASCNLPLPFYCYYFYVSLDFNIKLGQQFFIGFKGTTLSKETGLLLEKVQPGGIIFFEENIRDKNQVKNLIRDIKSILKIKPFIAIDQEGGSVERLRKICTSLPSQWGLAKISLKDLLLAHEIIALELYELGFNMNLAPVLDINSNSANPIIGTRSISNNPRIVSEYGKKIINLYINHGIVPVAKHFPGHGGLNIDSHIDLPILNKSKKELMKMELIPFISAIEIKAPCMMVAHIYLSRFEKEKNKPASLSKAILDDFLRKELKYKGLIITDELNMKGVTKNYSINKAAIHAFEAGADLLLFNQNEETTLKVFNHLMALVRKNKDFVDINNHASKNILLIKNKYINEKSRPYKKDLSRNRKTSYELANKVIHWCKKDLSCKPSTKNNIEIIFPDSPKLREEDLITICKKLQIKNYSLIKYEIDPNIKGIDKIISRLRNKSKKIIITYGMVARAGQQKLVNKISKIYKDTTIVSTDLEHDLELVQMSGNFIFAYAPNFISLYAAFKKLLF